MRVAIAYRTPIGPIQASLIRAAKEGGMDRLRIWKNKPWEPPDGKKWDDYDVVIHFNNSPPTFKTTAKVLWWMCDLRSPEVFPKDCTASNIFVCNHMFVNDYARHFGMPAHYLPQCGNDVEMKEGRKLYQDCLFLGIARGGQPFEKSNPFNLDQVRDLVTARRFHDNRVPVISEIQKEFKVRIISNEGLTKDQKWLYFTSPISLSISLPVPGYTSNRLFNILSSEGFALVNWFPGISELFENEKHLVWFRSPEEARELVRFYLEYPKERDRIRKAGHRLYIEKHTAAARIDFMLNEASR